MPSDWRGFGRTQIIAMWATGEYGPVCFLFGGGTLSNEDRKWALRKYSPAFFLETDRAFVKLRRRERARINLKPKNVTAVNENTPYIIGQNLLSPN